MKYEKIKPVFRLQGSKYRQLDFIINKLKLEETNVFVEPFGGSGIVSVNIKNIVNCEVILNDYDNLLSKDELWKNAILSQITYGGYGKNITESALNYFNSKLKNKWIEKVEKYQNILKYIHIVKLDYQLINYKIIYNKRNISYDDIKYYLDPPYFNKEAKGIYKKGNIDFNEFVKYANELTKKGDVLISINDSLEIREAFKDWQLTIKPITYTEAQQGKSKKVNELWFFKSFYDTLVTKNNEYDI